MKSLNKANIFNLKLLIKNFNIKKSAFVEDSMTRQTICLVGDNNEIVFRSSHKDEYPPKIILKTVVWFRESNRCIQDICFNPSGAMLLVLCYDNTLHSIPVFWVLNRSTSLEDFHLYSERITSFIVPFAGPHECPNSKTCPNNSEELSETSSITDKIPEYAEDRFSTQEIDELVASNSLYNNFYLEARNTSVENNNLHASDDTITIKPENDLPNSDGADIESKVSSDNENNTNPCPYPTSVVWWQTLDIKNYAIIGYSDGSICIVELRPNCPLVANTCIEKGAVTKMVICRDSIMNNITLMINSSLKEQWKLLLEQKSIGYVYPGDLNSNHSSANSRPCSDEQSSRKDSSVSSKVGDEDWQIVIPLNKSTPTDDSITSNSDNNQDSSSTISSQKEPVVNNVMKTSTNNVTTSGILPTARARLASLRDLGAKKIGALKLKLVESRMKACEKEKIKDQLTSFAIMNDPAMSPEILTTPTGPYFIVQYIKGTYLLSALHSYSDTLSVHSMNISLIPLYIYKIPKNCNEILVTPNFMYTVQNIASDNMNEISAENVCAGSSFIDSSQNCDTNNLNNAVGVVGCNTTALRIGEDSEFNISSLLALFKLQNERVIDIHRVGSSDIEATREYEPLQPLNKIGSNGIKSTQNYIKNHKRLDSGEEIDTDESKLMQSEFPKVEMDKCLVVTNRNLYIIELNDNPHMLFLNIAQQSQWNICEDFCKTFNLNFVQCIEYAGDVFLKEKKTTQALMAYNVAKIPPVKTALKLTMHGENAALMHLCAMALKIVYIIKSKYPASHHINYLQNTTEYQNSKSGIHKKDEISKHVKKNLLLTGHPCSDFSYEIDEAPSDLQLSNSSQFHLSNLLLLTLAERTIKEKQFMALWNFLVTNKRYHSKMTSIVLCQSGLYYSTVLLACARGAHLDAYSGLVAVTCQEFGWYNELNTILTNLSDIMFMECIVYLQNVSFDYFNVIQHKIDKIDLPILEKLKVQLNPFSPVYRPIVSQLSSNAFEQNTNEMNKECIDFCKFFIETYIVVLIKLYTAKNLQDNYMNALNSIYVCHEENQFSIKVENSLPISAGFSHCACIVDGSVYLWGSNGVNCALSRNSSTEATDVLNSPKRLQFITNMGLEVHAVECGRTHTLVVTNNGLYAMGANQLGQLGVGEYTAQALQPMLVREFDGKNISQIQSGQYHNAVVADGSLYTWGWGVYGQLGHGTIEDIYKPKIVSFFANKKIKQISLGHAHTLVLCSKTDDPLDTILYVFGSNHFGQLGIGQTVPAKHQFGDNMYNNFLKSLVPVEIPLAEKIRLIHTKFFTNFIVTQNNKLLVWGSSPQALRLQNQARKRAKASQKQDEPAKNEQQPSEDVNLKTKMNDLSSTWEVINENKNAAIQDKDDILSDKKVDCDDNAQQSSNNSINTTDVSNTINTTKSRSRSMSDLGAFKIEKEKALIAETKEKCNQAQQNGISFEEECNEHLYPSVVDTRDVIGSIIQVSSGLYHYALVTDHSKLYTWGKNLEKQIGRDSSRIECVLPTHLETIDNVLYVECGADFTLVMTTDYVVKAFGSNSFGQCGRDVSADKNSVAGKLVRLRVSKRLVRIPDHSQCIELPVDINLPRPKIQMDFEPVRYLKSIPKFKKRFIVKNHLIESLMPSQTSTIDSKLGDLCDQNLDITNCLDNLNIHECNKNMVGGYYSEEDTSDEMHNTVAQFITNNIETYLTQEETYPNEFIHYCLFIFHGLYDPSRIIDITSKKEFKIRVLMLNYRVKEAFSLCISDTYTAQQSITIFEYFTKDSSIVPIHREDLKFLIYEIFMHFINNRFNICNLEQFFLNDLDDYLIALAYVLYFSNNNTDLERQVLVKYANLFEHDLDYPTTLEHADLIFTAVSIPFKTYICQKLLDYDDNYN